MTVETDHVGGFRAIWNTLPQLRMWDSSRRAREKSGNNQATSVPPTAREQPRRRIDVLEYPLVCLRSQINDAKATES